VAAELLLARTTPLRRVKRKTRGCRCFYTDPGPSRIDVRLIHKYGRHAVDSNMLFIQDLWIPQEDRIGPEGEGFRLILHGLTRNAVLVPLKRSGIGRAASPGPPLRARRHRVQPADRHEPGHSTPARQVWAQLEAANLM